MDRNELLISLLCAELERKEAAGAHSRRLLKSADIQIAELKRERASFSKRHDEDKEKAKAYRALISDLIDAVRGKAFKISTEEGGTETLSIFEDEERGRLAEFFLQRAIGLDEA